MTPEPRPPSTEGAGELAAVIRAEIESSSEGRITFARFMERVLYEPGLGYY
jgi:SAM-dependent MidA family methyltransferase